MPREPRREHRVMGAASADKICFAREQRQHQTRSEMALWQRLRRGRLGVKFRRQHPIEDFVLDFYCEDCLLAVEIDGPQHEERAAYDRYRDERMHARGIRTLRFTSQAVTANLEAVLAAIRQAIEQPASRRT